MTRFNEYRSFAKRTASTFTNVPVKLSLENLSNRDPTHVSRAYDIEVHPSPGEHFDPYVEQHEIAIDRDYYEKHKDDPYEMKQVILHELAHYKSNNRRHTQKYRISAFLLGVDADHTSGRGRY